MISILFERLIRDGCKFIYQQNGGVWGATWFVKLHQVRERDENFLLGGLVVFYFCTQLQTISQRKERSPQPAVPHQGATSGM
eukprot:6474939-Amphidinium_carterae.1